MPPSQRSSSSAPSVRERILVAARGLLASGGLDALTNRAIAAAAGTQPPVIYRVFGDKQGLLQALAEAVFAEHLADKSSLEASDDPVADLRAGWDQHVAFGLKNPVVYVMVYGDVAEGLPRPAAVEAERMLAAYVHRVALVGRLRVSEELATQVLHATGRGVTLTLLHTPPDVRHPDLSQTAREAVIASITTNAGVQGPGTMTAAAVGLHAGLDQATALSEAERGLMAEWLDRLVDRAPTRQRPDQAAPS